MAGGAGGGHTTNRKRQQTEIATLLRNVLEQLAQLTQTLDDDDGDHHNGRRNPKHQDEHGTYEWFQNKQGRWRKWYHNWKPTTTAEKSATDAPPRPPTSTPPNAESSRPKTTRTAATPNPQPTQPKRNVQKFSLYHNIKHIVTEKKQNWIDDLRRVMDDHGRLTEASPEEATGNHRCGRR